MKTLDEVLAELDALGSPAAIAMRLEDLGVKGVRSQCDECPIAEHLAQTVGGFVFHVCSTAVSQWEGADRIVRVRLLDDTYPNVSEFIRGFDLGMYPELVR